MTLIGVIKVNNMDNNNGNGKEKIALHERIAKLEVNVKTILENHLPHLQETCDKLSNKFWAVIILLVANLVGLVVNFIK